MYSIVQCPKCSTKVKVDMKAGTASCPACRQRLSAPSEVEDEGGWPISPWALAAAGCAIAGILSASLIGIRTLTQLLAVLGVIASLIGLTVAKAPGKSKTFLMLGGGGGAILLMATLLFPGMLNRQWGLEVAVRQPSPDTQFAVSRDEPLEAGTPIVADEWTDALDKSIRQKAVLLSVESFKTGPVPDKGQTDYAQVHLRFTNVGGGQVTFAGFEESPPVLQDASGAACPFIEQRKRIPVQNLSYPVFGPARMEGVTLLAREKEDFLLVFEKPHGGNKDLKLTIPAKAWGLNGGFKFQIPNVFEASLGTPTN
jgi:hypothetical protein